jgi:hypothetical protein
MGLLLRAGRRLALRRRRRAPRRLQVVCHGLHLNEG